MRKQENGKGKQKLGDVINNFLGATTYLGSYLKEIDKINSGDVCTLPLECNHQYSGILFGINRYEGFTIFPKPSVLELINIIFQEAIQMLSNDHKIILR